MQSELVLVGLCFKEETSIIVDKEFFVSIVGMFINRLDLYIHTHGW